MAGPRNALQDVKNLCLGKEVRHKFRDLKDSVAEIDELLRSLRW